MSDDPKRPLKNIFNTVGNDKSTTEEDHRTVADKDNSGLTPSPPSFSKPNSPDRAPAGTVPVQPPKHEEEIDVIFIPAEETEADMNLGTDDVTLDEEINGYRVLTKVDDVPNENGIDGGRISRLAFIDQEGEASVYFENGDWIREPSTPLENQMIDDIKEDLNQTPEKEFKRIDFRSNDHDHDI